MSCDPRLRELLPAWAAGELEPAEARAVERHLEVCSRCRELADRLASIQRCLSPLRELQAPAPLAGDLTGDSCGRWRRVLFAAMDGAVDEDGLAPLLDHLEECPACTAVWTAFTAAREVLVPLEPPQRLVERCRRVPWAARRRRVPGIRTAAAAAYVFAVAVSLLLGNPVTLARRQVDRAAVTVGTHVETKIRELKDDGRGEFRLMVWKIWKLGENTVDAVHKILSPKHPKDTPDKGEST